tara:strand:- start:713 stop:1306 length:594 start_codon:yes stop_codon:yes gene_type:complete
MNLLSRHTLLISLTLFSSYSFADVYVTPWLGYTIGGNVENQDGEDFELQGSHNLALSLETDFDNGRLGLFYTDQSTQVDEVKLDANTHYLHFQSSIHYPLEEKLSSYLGLGLGGSYIDAEWVDDNLGFSASIFGGFEYEISDSLAINGQARWLGTVVDNDTTGVCNLPSSGSDSCVIQFKTSWMNQFSTNLGITWRF